MLSPEIISEENKTPNHYIEQAEKLLAHNQKDRALQILKEGIFALGGSQAPESAELMALWWDTMLWNPENDSQALTAEEQENIFDIAELLSGTRCYLQSNELPARSLFQVFKYIHWDVTAEKSEAIANAYPFYSPNDARYADLLVFPLDTVERFIRDLFGVRRENLVQEYYMDRFGRSDYAQFIAAEYFLNPIYTKADVDYWDALNYMEVLETEMKENTEYIESVDFPYEENTYYLAAGDPEAPKYWLQGYQYLGDNMYYVILYGDYITKDEEDINLVDGLVHLIVKRSDTPLGFTAIAKPQDLFAEGNRSLIQPGWSKPALTLWE
jgi:hypothetical protein